jgi:hypothetical protein
MALADGGTEPVGITALMWGTFATVVGWLTVADYRGVTRWLIRTPRASRSSLRRSPSAQPLPQQRHSRGEMIRIRVLGGIFAVVGPIVLIIEIVAIAHGHAGSLFGREANVPGPLVIMAVVFPVLWLAQFWWPRRGWFLTAWRIGGALRRSLSLIFNLAGHPTC